MGRHAGGDQHAGVLAAVTERATLGTLVASVVNRHPALLGKAFATLDVLSGRSCGVRPRHRLVREGGAGLRISVPSPRRAVRHARGRRRGPPSDVGPWLAPGERPHDRRARGDGLPAPDPGATPHPHRRLGGTDHPAPGGPPCRISATCAANRPWSPPSSTRSGATAPRSVATATRSRYADFSVAFTAPDRTALTERLGAARRRSESVEQAAARLGAGVPDDLIGRFRGAGRCRRAACDHPGSGHHRARRRGRLRRGHRRVA